MAKTIAQLDKDIASFSAHQQNFGQYVQNQLVNMDGQVDTLTKASDKGKSALIASIDAAISEAVDGSDEHQILQEMRVRAIVITNQHDLTLANATALRNQIAPLIGG